MTDRKSIGRRTVIDGMLGLAGAAPFGLLGLSNGANAGDAARQRLSAALELLLESRLKGFSRDEIMLCARLLGDFARDGAND